ncbi:hypothetical protein [Pantoea agglomerans]|nr:hypothetical protein [Pantoea agglomerans]MBD8133808.1 hypothetical protein [Pantoea agglomerans]
MEFMDWFAQLNDIAISKGFANAGDPEKWHGEFNDGLTPQQAWDGDWDLY